ncbi:hypothetical protein ACUXAV_000700 [Cupriavidus metallidurans]|uniref:hypothetical protein n=1 Tax=Cupriavidus metallidurans TaxID=119219 RepID=UPI0004938581|nr:hypothetical protein [Cupriavidus metallidurans]MDE4918601.1 hypothetical protein [Cupriavidus metallidurans]
MDAASFIVVAVCHTTRDHHYITLWRPDNNGYTPVVPRAGRYSAEQIARHLDYYNSGYHVAVPAALVEQLGVEPPAGFFDYAGPAVPNSAANWKLILDSAPWLTNYPPEPEHFRKRRRNE